MANRYTGVEVVEWDGQTPYPPVAPAGKARLVYETVDNCLALSISGGAYQCLLFGNQVGGGGIIAAGSEGVPVAVGQYWLAPWNDAAPAEAGGHQWIAPADGTLRNFYVLHNVPGGAAEPITYEWYVNNVATGLSVVLNANAVSGSNLVTSVAVAQGDVVDLRATHAGLTSSPERIVATAVFGAGRFGDNYQRVDSPALFLTGLGMASPTAFVVKPGAVLVTPPLTGTYLVRWHAMMNTSSANVEGSARMFNLTDGVQVGSVQRFEPTSSSTELEDLNDEQEIVFTGASKTFQIEVRKFAGPNPGAVALSAAWLSIWRVGP